MNLVQAIATITTKPDPLSHHRALEEAVSNDWILTTGEIERLLGVSIRAKGDYYDLAEIRYAVRGCWRFTKAGRIGREQGWRVRKI